MKPGHILFNLRETPSVHERGNTLAGERITEQRNKKMKQMFKVCRSTKLILVEAYPWLEADEVVGQTYIWRKRTPEELLLIKTPLRSANGRFISPALGAAVKGPTA